MVHLRKLCINQELFSITHPTASLSATLGVPLGTLANNKKQTFEVSVPYPNINLPREFPPIFRMPRDMPFVSLIDDVIDSCIENGCTQSPDWILFHAQVHLSRGSPRNAIRLIMNEVRV